MAVAAVAWADLAGQAPPTDDDLVLLQPYLQQTPLGDGVEAYASGGAVLVPLGEVCRLLAFGIKVNPERTVAEGFFINPKRTFRLDLGTGRVQVEGRPGKLRRAITLPRDLYVDAASLGEWFPLEVKVLLKESALVIRPKEKLPLQEAWERESRYGQGSVAPRDQENSATGIPHPVPYTLFDLPMADLDLSYTKAHPDSNTVTGSATLGGDLLWMSSDIYAYRDSNGSWSGSRYTLFREDPSGHLLGPMRGRNLDLGDLPNIPSMDVVGSLPSGRGVNLDNFPVTYGTRFGSRTFDGPLPEGWSVECFQNDALIGFQQARPDGRYQFLNVPLRFGVNLIRLVFHGPAGERREQTYRLDYAQNQPAPGTLYYGLSGLHPNSSDWTLNTNVVDASGLNTRPSPRSAYMVSADYGLTPAASLRTASAGLELQDGYHRYFSLGAKTVGSFLALQVSSALDQGPAATGRAAEVVLGTGFGYSTLTVRRDQFWSGFQRSPYGGNALGATGVTVKQSTELDLDTSGTLREKTIALSFQMVSEGYVGGGHGLRNQLLLSTQLGRTNVTNSLTRTQTPDLDLPLQGQLTVTSFAQEWSWDGSLQYSCTGLNGWGAEVQRSTPNGWQYQAGLRGPLGPSGVAGAQGPLEVSGRVQKTSGRFGLGLNAQASHDAYSATLELQISLGREPRTRKWATDAQSLATTGSVSALAFLDTRGTGVRGPDDPILEGTRFRVSGSEVTNQIQDPAVTLITKLAPNQAVDVSLDERSLDDPAQKAGVKAVKIVPRQGKVARVEIPVTTVGYVNGTTRVLRNGRREELPGLEVELLDAQGRRIKFQRSAYDGFYEFQDLPYGAYTLRVPPEEAERIQVLPVERKIRIEAGHNFLDGLDLVVEPRTGPERKATP